MIQTSEDFIKRDIDKAATHNLGYVSVKGLQYKVISEVLNIHDALAVLPTGFKKSFTHAYHIYPKSETKSLLYHFKIRHFARVRMRTTNY